MNSINITTEPLYEYECQFAFCNSCFWSATNLRSEEKRQQQDERANIILQTCPICNNKGVSLTPLEKNEVYRISSFGTKRGLEMQFSLKK